MQNKTIHTLETECKNPLQYYINDNGCYECTSHKSGDKGYITISANKKRIKVHIYLYQYFIGEIPEGKIVMHLCDNPKCLNIKHYTLGTVVDNINDMYQKGRRIQKNNVRLSVEQKIEICKSNLKNSEIREIYGIGESTIKDIRKAYREGRLILNE